MNCKNMAYMLPDESPIDFGYDDGMASVRFDKMKLYAMFVLEV